ncbi:unnamed protein product, partial [Ectocarpus fasciculatus]
RTWLRRGRGGLRKVSRGAACVLHRPGQERAGRDRSRGGRHTRRFLAQAQKDKPRGVQQRKRLSRHKSGDGVVHEIEGRWRRIGGCGNGC